MRIMALRSLDNQEIFAELAKDAKSEWVRDEATKRLNVMQENEK